MSDDKASPDHSGRVIGRRVVTPHLVCLTLGDIRTRDGASPLPSSGRADDFFTLWIPTPDGELVPRYYTVRAWRPQIGELDVELLLHGKGPATEWAARAVIGDRIGFDQPRGHYQPPADAEWIGLCGDATALPAIARVLEERLSQPAAVPVRVVVALDDDADRQTFTLRPGDTLEWVRPTELAERAKALAGIAAPGYLWFSGEAADMRAVRHTLRRERRVPSERWMTMGYWRRDRERWLARYEAAGEDFHHRLDEIYSSGDDDQTQVDRAEELLAQEGLL